MDWSRIFNATSKPFVGRYGSLKLLILVIIRLREIIDGNYRISIRQRNILLPLRRKTDTDKGNFRWKLVIYRGARYFVFICTLKMVEPNVIFEQSHRRLYGAPVKLFEP